MRSARYIAWWAAILAEASAYCAMDLAEYVGQKARAMRRRVR